MEDRYVRQFKKGALEMILLCLIAQGETYGYELLTRLNQQGGSVLGYAREGTIYPSSTGCRSRGCYRSAWPPPRPTGG